MTVASATVANPTVMEIRAPYTTRLQTSRERLSVPIQNLALGGFMRLPGTDSFYEGGAIAPANTAKMSRLRTMMPPMAPSGLRRAKTRPTRAMARTAPPRGSAGGDAAGG